MGANNSSTLERRQFLKILAVGGAALAGLQLKSQAVASSTPEGSSPYQWAMLIDLSACVGCGYCSKACRAHNDIAPDITWNRVTTCEFEGQTVRLPQPCMQCEHAPCVDVCPVKASYYRPDGIVMMNYDLCIGCRYCEVACPYGARSFNWQAFHGENPAVPEWGQPEVERRPRGVVEKCSFCYQRIDRGMAQGLTPGVDSDATPACAVACPVGARVFGDINDPESPVSLALTENSFHQIREDLGTGPRVYYLCPKTVWVKTWQIPKKDVSR